ncbi:unnamed protein product [Penicillium egyptiacum]|uniref:Major facilitator superfamily (MFS) profile domain-containing protein n=1 Tax=Penicillium egyptiacum TaxID=1303716 RepID=A0A9W4P1D7_9EURO|nr:unnamed protein product [Penicillium egyptiacum]
MDWIIPLSLISRVLSSRDLGDREAQLAGQWLPLGSIALLLAVGKAYGLWDIKWLWVLSIIIFQIGSAICGAAPNMNALIIGRVIAGTGGAGMYLG